MRNLNKSFLISSLLLIVFYSNTYPQNIGFIKIGNDFLLNNKYDITGNGQYKLNHFGISVGFLIPIKIKYINTYYKVELNLHKIIEKKYPYKSNWFNDNNLFDKHISGLNEILIGKSIYLNSNNNILPQIGLGFQIESLYKKSPRNSVDSITYNTLLFDIALSYLYSLNNYSIGIMLNWSQGIKKSTFVYDATDRIGLSLIFGI